MSSFSADLALHAQVPASNPLGEGHPALQPTLGGCGLLPIPRDHLHLCDSLPEP